MSIDQMCESDITTRRTVFRDEFYTYFSEPPYFILLLKWPWVYVSTLIALTRFKTADWLTIDQSTKFSLPPLFSAKERWRCVCLAALYRMMLYGHLQTVTVNEVLSVVKQIFLKDGGRFETGVFLLHLVSDVRKGFRESYASPDT